jgi:hypothetical protein
MSSEKSFVIFATKTKMVASLGEAGRTESLDFAERNRPTDVRLTPNAARKQTFPEVRVGPIPLKKSVRDRSGPDSNANRHLSGRFWLRHWDQLG